MPQTQLTLTQTQADHRLSNLFAARSVVVVGASERNLYAIIALESLREIGYTGRVHMVNRRGGTVSGQPAFSSCREVGEPIDTAYICVPVAGVIEAVADVAAAGAKNVVVLSSGFAEIGESGRALQKDLVALCQAHGLRMLGPNCLGFINYSAKLAVGSIALSLPQPDNASLALISASGATALQLSRYAQQCGVGLTHVIATGNEADITTADCIDYLLDQPEVKAIGLFLEAVGDIDPFLAAVSRARSLRKPIIVLKVGASPVTAAVAAAHTGVLVGNDNVFDAMCRRWGIVRVSTFEQLVTTASALSSAGPIAQSGIACVSLSGGACEVLADLALCAGVSLPEFAPGTKDALRGVLSDLGQAHNPLDLTGAAVPDPEMWERVMRIVSQDPRIGLVLCHFEPPDVAEPPLKPMLECIARAMHDTSCPSLMVTSCVSPVNEFGLAYFAGNGLPPALQGLGDGVFAAGRLAWWSERLTDPPPAADRSPLGPTGQRPRSEREALEYLSGAGVPVIPTRLVMDEAAAIDAAREMGGKVVLKVASADIAHKTDIGGVLLGLEGDEVVGDGFRRIMRSVTREAPKAQLDGILVAPMREGGTELFVGISRDPQWGLTMALGLGGIWVELLRDTRLLMLPAGPEEIAGALGDLRGAQLLHGYRGSAPVDLDAVATVIARIGEAAERLGPDLAALEINPLLVQGSEAEVLDALAVWND